MLTYVYGCDTNGKVVGVKYAMSALLTTWGELRERSGHRSSDTASDCLVTQLVNGGQIVKRPNIGDSVFQGCDTVPCCDGRCG